MIVNYVWTIAQSASAILIVLLLLFLIKVVLKQKWYFPLLICVALFGLDLGIEIIANSKLISKVPHLLYINEPFNLLYGVMIFLYARGHELQRLKFYRKDFLFFIPFLLSVLNYIPYYFIDGTEKVTDFIASGNVSSDINENIWEWIFMISINLVFLWAALNRFQNYTSKIKALYSDIQQKDFHRTQFLIKTVMAFYLLQLIVVYLIYYGVPYSSSIYNFYDLVMIILLSLIGYDALQSYKFASDIRENWEKIQLLGKANKYAKSTLTQANSELIKTKLETCMAEEKPFLNPQIRIKELAELTGFSTHQLSQVLNESFGQNFYEFINTQRINTAKLLLTDKNYENFTFTAIGFEAGFNSKTAFYTAFKKETGTTPANFKHSNTSHN